MCASFTSSPPPFSFTQLKDEKPAPPTRGRSAGGGGGDDDEDDDDDDDGGGGGAAMEDLVPRNDVGAKFDGALITELGDKNWKVRWWEEASQ